MIGTCRNCKRVLSFDETRCPFCGAERPVDLPWAVERRPVQRRWPAAARRWIALAVVSLALAVAVSVCSAAAAAPPT